jgi:intein/homing endonuclease
MARKKKKQPSKKNDIEALMRDYARAVLTLLADTGTISIDERVVEIIKEASDKFLNGVPSGLLEADVGAIVRLVRPSRSTHGNGNGNNASAGVRRTPAPQTKTMPPPLLGYIEEGERLFGDEDYDYGGEIDF